MFMFLDLKGAHLSVYNFMWFRMQTNVFVATLFPTHWMLYCTLSTQLVQFAALSVCTYSLEHGTYLPFYS